MQDHILEPIDDNTLRNDVLGLGAVLVGPQELQLLVHFTQAVDQFVDLTLLQPDRHLRQEVEHDLVKNLKRLVLRPAAALEVRVEGAARGNEAEDMGEDSFRALGLAAKVGRFRCGEFDQRVKRDQFGDQLAADFQSFFVVALPGVNGPARGVLQGDQQFLPRLGGGVMRCENRHDKNRAGDASQDAGDARHRDKEDLVGRIDRAGGNQARGITGEHGSISTEIGQRVGSDRAPRNDESEAEHKQLRRLREERDERDAQDRTREGAENEIQALRQQHARRWLRHNPDRQPRPIRRLQLEEIGDEKREQRGHPCAESEGGHVPRPRGKGDPLPRCAPPQAI